MQLPYHAGARQSDGIPMRSGVFDASAWARKRMGYKGSRSVLHPGLVQEILEHVRRTVELARAVLVEPAAVGIGCQPYSNPAHELRLLPQGAERGVDGLLHQLGL